MNSVRQVSIVLRDVAETVLVTERPKKLNPLSQFVRIMQLIESAM